MNASWLPAGGAARSFGIVKPGRRVAGPACKSPMATVFDDQGPAERPGDKFRRRQISMFAGFPNALPVCGLCQHPAVVQTAFFLPCGARRGGHSARTGAFVVEGRGGEARTAVGARPIAARAPPCENRANGPAPSALLFCAAPRPAAPMAGSAGRFCDQGNAPAARAGNRPLPLHEQQQAHRHHRHAADEAVNGKMVFAVFPRRGQQFVKGDEHHDAGHRGEEDAEHRV